MTAVLQATDAFRSDRLMVPQDDKYVGPHYFFSSSTDWKAKYMEVADMLAETRAELDDFHASSKELEEELERELERTEKAQQDLKVRVARAEQEKDEWKSKFMSLQTMHNTTTTSLQRELDTLRQEHQKIKIQLRELEMGNDDLERNERAISSSLADIEQKYSRVLEEKILLEHELLDKANVEEESQRLRDELRDANEEISILKEQLAAASARAASISDLPSSTAPSVTSHGPSEDDESLLSTPAPPDLQLADLTPPPETPAKDFPPITTLKSPHSSELSAGQASLLQRAGFQPPRAGSSTTTASPSSLTRSKTTPGLSSSPSRVPRTPTSRPVVASRAASTMSSTSTITGVPGTTSKSRGVQMVSEMRARVKVLEQKIHTRVPRLRMGSVTNRASANAMPPPKAGPSTIPSPVATRSPSLRSNDDRSTGLASRRSVDSENDHKRTPAADTSGWVLIMEDSPSPSKDRDKVKEMRRTSSPSAPSAFRPLASTNGSSSPSMIARPPSGLSQSVAPSRRPQSRLSVSTEGRSSVSTNATTSTMSSIPTPSSRPSTPTFLPVPSSGMYQSTLGMKRSSGPSTGAYSSQTKRSSYGSANNSPSSNMGPPSSIPHGNRPIAKISPSASFGQSRIGRPNSGRKSGGENEPEYLSDTGPTSKFGRGRAGSASALFGRRPL
ncbi:hypothetical protein K474DRAFT_1590025 [Panus rudis PR-1116 ss-1]|nr:hypothetical protein K474DRAFT_1590025 [Panus rudis PR-1116 ss-1]